MGAPASGIKAAEDSSAEVLLSKFKNIAAAERRRHATVFNYWLSIRGDRHFPPIRDLDPLEISDAGPSSVLLELIGGGEDAEIRHLGQALKNGAKVESISEAPRPSLLSCIAQQLPVVASARKAVAFEDEFPTASGSTRCWVTLLPFSSTGTYVDYVYGFVSLETAGSQAEKVPESEKMDEGSQAPENLPEAVSAEGAIVEEESESAPEVAEDVPEPVSEAEAAASPVDSDEDATESAEDDSEAPQSEERRPGFSKFFDALAGVGGFYGNVIQMDPKVPSGSVEDQDLEEQAFEAEEPEPEADPTPEPEAVPEADEPVSEIDEPVSEIKEPETQEATVHSKESTSVPEGYMQTKLTEVRAKADEARAAKLRANAALYEGLSAAYDFALDAEENAEDYLKLVEAQGLKIQLRSPMKPVVKLAFEGMCDDSTIAQLEAVLAWALKQDLPRGTLAERIEAEGGLGPILNGKAAA